MSSSHSIQYSLVVDTFKCRVAVAHDGLPDIIQTMITVDWYFFRCQIFDCVVEICQSQEVLLNISWNCSERLLKIDLLDNEADETWKHRI